MKELVVESGGKLLVENYMGEFGPRDTAEEDKWVEDNQPPSEKQLREKQANEGWKKYYQQTGQVPMDENGNPLNGDKN